MTTPKDSEKDKKGLLQKIPELAQRNRLIGLQMAHFKKLSDAEFTILWYMPGLDIDIDQKTQIYIEVRRRALGLKFNQFVGYKARKGGEG